MHIEIPSPARLRKISEHVESEEGLSFMERTKRIHEIDSIDKADNSVVSCQSPRIIKKSSKSSGKGMHHSFFHSNGDNVE
jgi:hypothetical protein